MRFTLAHLVPLVLVLNPILAASADKSSITSVAASTDAASSSADATDSGKASPTDSSATSTGDSKSAKSTSKASKSQASATDGSEATDTWKPTIPATVAPDLNAAGPSMRNTGIMGSLGLVSLGTVFMVLL